MHRQQRHRLPPVMAAFGDEQPRLPLAGMTEQLAEHLPAISPPALARGSPSQTSCSQFSGNRTVTGSGASSCCSINDSPAKGDLLGPEMPGLAHPPDLCGDRAGVIDTGRPLHIDLTTEALPCDVDFIEQQQ